MLKYPKKKSPYFKTDQATFMACLGLALIFWVLLKLSQSFQTSRQVNLHYEIPEDKLFQESPPEVAELKIQGVGWDLIASYFANPKYKLTFDLNGLPESTIGHSQLLEMINPQIGNLQIVDLSIDYINLKLEDKWEKKVPVILNYEFTFESGFNSSDSVLITPDSVLLSGPKSLIETLDSWPTEAVQKKNINSNISESVSLLQAKNQQLKLQPTAVQVQLTVEQFTEKSFWVPVEVINPPSDSLVIFPETVQVTCVVGLSRYDRLSANDFVLQLDLNEILPGTEKTSKALQLTKQPSFVKKVSFHPKSVEFFVVRENVEE